MKKLIALLIVLVVLVLLFSAAACGTKAPEASASPSPSAEATPSGAPSPAGTSITVTDMIGREVKLNKPAEKIVALTAADCEILYALGAGSTVVGRGEYCDYPEAVLSVPSVQSGADTNIEQIVALRPDAVIMSTMAQTEEQIASLESAGITVIVSEARKIEDVYKAVILIGSVVGKNDKAKAVVDVMKKTFDEIKAKVQSGDGQTVYFEVSPLEYGLWSAGTGTFMDELGTMLGLTNIFADVEGWAEVSEEQVIRRNPDFIVTTTMSYDGAQNPVEEVMGREGWSDIAAIKNGMVLNADSDAVTRPGPRLADAAQELFDFIYGG